MFYRMFGAIVIKKVKQLERKVVTDVVTAHIDDLFVSKDWRKQGIGENLMNRAFVKLKCLHINESRLEVWSANKRALSVYNKLGYQFLKETEVSIGMFL